MRTTTYLAGFLIASGNAALLREKRQDDCLTACRFAAGDTGTQDCCDVNWVLATNQCLLCAEPADIQNDYEQQIEDFAEDSCGFPDVEFTDGGSAPDDHMTALPLPASNPQCTNGGPAGTPTSQAQPPTPSSTEDSSNPAEESTPSDSPSPTGESSPSDSPPSPTSDDSAASPTSATAPSNDATESPSATETTGALEAASQSSEPPSTSDGMSSSLDTSTNSAGPSITSSLAVQSSSVASTSQSSSTPSSNANGNADDGDEHGDSGEEGEEGEEGGGDGTDAGVVAGGVVGGVLGVAALAGVGFLLMRRWKRNLMEAKLPEMQRFPGEKM